MGISKRATALTTLVASALAVVGLAMPAQAEGGCPATYTCVWKDASYSGTHLYSQINAGNFSGSVIDNAASSAEANGGSCTTTYYYDTNNHTGASFYLNSRTLVDANFEDPHLANGAGKGSNASENWDNRISSYKFTGCS